MESISYLTFKIGEEKFAAHVSKVLNIVEQLEITHVPQAPKYMLGVINLRGMVLPLIDSRIKLGLPVTENTVDTCIVVCELEMENERVHTGFLVDAVDEVLEIEEGEILPPPSLGSKYKSRFIKGIYNQNDSFIMLMDMDYLFNNDELQLMAEMNKELEEEQA